ncbi:MAG: C40 family peptidase [Gammaproteobacteria bacterium]|nr:C40 family peptidase [Gammaproteobacteria bacterium]MCP5458928.1 C40 family peptidase [Gammaproteobacteria bacterium]
MLTDPSHSSIHLFPCILLVLLGGCAMTPSSPTGVDSSGLDYSIDDPTRQHVVGIAKSLLGVPYEWGGSDPNGVDCSGLVNYTFEQIGIHVPRTAEQLYVAGRKLRRVQPGDLLFYQTSSRGRISHVGIYIGHGQMIHASTSQRRVIKADISQPYWRKRWVGSATYLACVGPHC